MKKNLRRITAVIVVPVILALLAATAACGAGKKNEEDRVVVHFWGHFNEAWNISHLEAIERFNASQDKIEVEAVFFPYDEFEEKILHALTLGEAGADVYEIWGGWMVDFISSGTLSQVPDHLIADLVNDCYEPVLGALKGGDGKYYGVPLEFNIEYGGMLVNKPRFEELGIAYPETWNEVAETARKTTKKSGNLWTMRGLDFTADDTLTTTFLSMILSMGGEYWVDGKLKLATPEAENALVTLVDFVKADEITNLDSATGAQGDEVEGFDFLGRDEAMMVPRGPWAISELEENYGKTLGVDFDYVKFPFYGQIPAFPAETGWSMCVSKNSAAAKAAWEYLEFFLEHDNLMRHNINCAQVSPRKSVIGTPDYVSRMPYLAPLLDIVEYGRFIGPFNTDVLKSGLRNTYMSLCSGDGKYASVSEALADLEKNLNEQLGLK